VGEEAVRRYDYGDQVPLTRTFLVDDVPTDPTTVTLKLITPAGGTISIPGTATTHLGAGSYSYGQNGTIEGVWTWRWESTGTPQDCIEGQFGIRATPFY